MASFGHVAVGLLTGRLHGGGGKGGSGGDGGRPEDLQGQRRPCSWATLTVFAALALLPDADVILVALGTCDAGACGHRGASHSLPVALAIGLVGGYVAHRLRWPVLRTILATTFAVGSHALLDLLGAGGRGLPLFWPFSSERFMSPIRIFPDAPRGSAFLSRPGVISIAIEFAVFLPVMIYALWPRIAGWLSARAFTRRIPKLPSLTFIEKGDALFEKGDALFETGNAVFETGNTLLEAGDAGLSSAPGPAPTPPVADEGDPSVRSAG